MIKVILVKISQEHAAIHVPHLIQSKQKNLDVESV